MERNTKYEPPGCGPFLFFVWIIPIALWVIILNVTGEDVYLLRGPFSENPYRILFILFMIIGTMYAFVKWGRYK